MLKSVFLAPILAACTAAAEAPADDPQILASAEAPALTLRIDPAFTPLPPLLFPIENLTDVDRRVFVDAGPDRTIRRMIVVQFEKAQAGSDFRFVFPSTPPRRFGAQTYRAGTFAYDEAAAAARAPDREPAQTRRFLGDRGYRLPSTYKAARLARVSDPQGLSEVILFYFEAADSAYPQGLPADGADLSAEESERLFRALESSVEVISG